MVIFDRVRNCAFLVANATKNLVLATRISQLVTRICHLVIENFCLVAISDPVWLSGWMAGFYFIATLPKLHLENEAWVNTLLSSYNSVQPETHKELRRATHVHCFRIFRFALSTIFGSAKGSQNNISSLVSRQVSQLMNLTVTRNPSGVETCNSHT